MQNKSQLIYLIGFLVLAVTSCMAQTLFNPTKVDGSVHHLINKRQSNCVTLTYGAPFPCPGLTCYFGGCTVTYDPARGSLTSGGCCGVTVNMRDDGVTYCCNN